MNRIPTLACMIIFCGLLSGCNKPSSSTFGIAQSSSKTTASLNQSPDAASHAGASPGEIPVESKAAEAPGNSPGKTNIPNATHNDGKYLTTERHFLTNNNLSQKTVSTALDARDFSKIVDRFAQDAANDQDARDVSRLYQEDIAKDVGINAVGDFACGLSICAGIIRTHGDNSGYRKWADGFINHPRLPSYSFIYRTINLGGGDFENRFFFSVDPSANGITFPYAPTPPKP